MARQKPASNHGGSHRQQLDEHKKSRESGPNSSGILKLKGFIRNETPIILGAAIGVIILGMIKNFPLSFPNDDPNLYVVRSPCMRPAANVRVYNDAGNYATTDIDGVIKNPPQHWTVEGTVLRVMFQGRVFVLSVGSNGLLEIPAGCDIESPDN